jgi:hypothetical protein
MEKIKNTQEKVWFLYVVDHHEGPFTIEEIKQKIKNKQALPTSYVWREPMNDWATIDSLEEFGFKKTSNESVAQANTTSSNTSKASILGFKNTNTQNKETNTSMKKNKKFSVLTLVLLIALLGTLGIGIKMGLFSNLMSTVPLQSQTIKLKLRPLLKPIAQKLPQSFKKFLLGIELPEDINTSDENLLIEAALSSLSQGGKIAISRIPKNDVLEYFITTNLPSGTELQVLISSIPDRILYARSFNINKTVTVQNSTARILIANQDMLSKIPQGDYRISVFDSDTQLPEIASILSQTQKVQTPTWVPKNRTAFFTDTIFLNGTKNNEFEQKLKEYNQAYKDKLENEKKELHEFYTNLYNSANETASKFFALLNQKKNTKLKAKEWLKISNETKNFIKQIYELSSNTNLPAQDSMNIPARIYLEQYNKVSECAKNYLELLELEDNFFQNKTDLKTIQDKASLILENLNQLKQLIDGV